MKSVAHSITCKVRGCRNFYTSTNVHEYFENCDCERLSRAIGARFIPQPPEYPAGCAASIKLGGTMTFGTKCIAYQVNRLLVWLGLLLAVLPAALDHLATTLFLIFATPALWLAYVVGWWAISSLIRLFLNFLKGSPVPGGASWLGIIAGSVTVIVLLWPVFTGAPPCTSCSKPPGLLTYRPNLLCVLVGLHWTYLYWRGFRLTGRSSGPPSASAELQR